MKHLELHILQSFPVACLNRDDLNSPKTAIFGGVQRARISSQCWKSSVRKLAREELPCMAGQRTRRLVSEIAGRLESKGINKAAATVFSELTSHLISKLDNKKDEKGYRKVKTLAFLSPMELDAISEEIANNAGLLKAQGQLETLTQKEGKTDDEEKDLEKLKKTCKSLISKREIAKAIKMVNLKDAADIALFGRMVAEDASLTLEGAAMFSHALSTHKADNEIDFFAAVDDLQPKEHTGAGMTGTLEFNSATYYRFAAVNLDMLADEHHLGDFTQADRKKIVGTFVQSTLMAVPVAMRNSMNANTLPGYVLGIVREKGHPIQLVNAFENPVRPTAGKGLFELSRENLLSEYESLKNTWDLDEKKRSEMPKDDLKSFLKKVTCHVA